MGQQSLLLVFIISHDIIRTQRVLWLYGLWCRGDGIPEETVWEFYGVQIFP